MYTANTMSSAFEAMGMSLMYSSTMAAEDAEKADSAEKSAITLLDAIRHQRLPRQIITRESIENAIAVIMAIGGSTNAVLHFLAIAHAANVPLTLDDFETIGVECRSSAISSRPVATLPPICIKQAASAGDENAAGTWVAHGDCLTYHRGKPLPNCLQTFLTNRAPIKT
jgi:hypothetical protein